MSNSTQEDFKLLEELDFDIVCGKCEKQVADFIGIKWCGCSSFLCSDCVIEVRSHDEESHIWLCPTCNERTTGKWKDCYRIEKI